MRLFKCKTGRFMKGTILLAIVFFFVNAILFTYKCCRRHHHHHHQDAEDENINTTNAQPHHDTQSVNDLIKYRNKYWQFHSSGCPDSDPRKFEECLLKNRSKNTYEEVVVYSSFYDDRTSPMSSRWVHILGVIKIVPKPSPLFCRIWLKVNSSVADKYHVANSTTIDRKSKIVKIKRDESSDQPSWIAEFPAISHTTGRNHHMKGISYGQRHFACPLNDIPASFVPTHSSLTFKRNEKSSIFLPVHYPADKTRRENNRLIYKHEFVICVTQAYDKIHPTELMEWIELHRMLGVTKINIYNGTVLPDEKLESVLKYYTDLDVLTVRQIPPAVANHSNAVEATRLSSPASLNDCMMRYLKSARWVIVVDFDEVILPLEARSYSNLMKQVLEMEKKVSTTTQKTKKVTSPSKVTLSHSNLVSSSINKVIKSSINNNASSTKSLAIKRSIIDDVGPSLNDDGWSYHTYMFRMAYFLRNVNESMIRNESLFTSKYRWRTKPLEYTFSPKSFVDPRKCLSVFNHFCYLTWASQPQKKFDVDPKVAFVRHYRKSCSLAGNRCKTMANESVLDENMMRFEDELKLRMEQVRKEIFE